MPISTAPYKRSYKHSVARGKEYRIPCEYCHNLVPRYKTFVVRKSMLIKDPLILQSVNKKHLHLLAKKVRICPSCARFRGISQPGKSLRKRTLK